MSIQPTTKTPVCSLDQNPFAAYPQKSLVRCWFDAIQNGQNAEKHVSYDYCKRDWTRQTGYPAEEAPDEFMKQCQSSHRAFMQFVRWARVN